MAFTTADFEAMKPEPYSDARHKLRTGDILLFSSTGVFSRVIEHFTDSLWSHSALVWRVGTEKLDRVLLLESIENIGIRAVSANFRINGAGSAKAYTGKLALVRHKLMPHPMTHDSVSAMTRFGIDHLGYPYSPEELIKIAARITLGLAGVTLHSQLHPVNSYICSEFVAKCYEAVDIKLAPDVEGFMAPADIAADPNIMPVVALCPDLPA
jgi:hypothetical protein